MIVDVDPRERWAVLCQARADTDHSGAVEIFRGMHGMMFGDALVPYLVEGGGEGVEIDAFVRASRDGRWLAYARAGRLLLRDEERGVDTDLSALGADSRDDADPLARPRAVSFSPDGTRAVYIRQRVGRAMVVVRSLPGGEERELDPGAGEVWRARPLDGGWVRVDVVASDTDGNGRLELPRVRTTLSARRCRGAPSVYGVYGMSGDRPVSRLFAGGAARPVEVPEVVAVWGDAVIAREGGALVRARADGTRVTLSPASCAARVLGVYAARRRALIACSSTSERDVAVELLSAEGTRPIGYRVAPPDRDDEGPGRFVLFYAVEQGSTSNVYYDLDALRAVTPPGVVDRDIEAMTLMRRSGAWIIHDFDRGADTPLPFTVAESGTPTRYGAFAYLGGALIDVAHARVLGRVAREPITVNDAGRALLAASVNEHEVEIGPLRWQTPETLLDAGR